MVICSPTVQSLAKGNLLGFAFLSKTVGRNYVGDFISDRFQSLSFKDRMHSTCATKGKVKQRAASLDIGRRGERFQIVMRFVKQMHRCLSTAGVEE